MVFADGVKLGDFLAFLGVEGGLVRPYPSPFQFFLRITLEVENLVDSPNRVGGHGSKWRELLFHIVWRDFRVHQVNVQKVVGEEEQQDERQQVEEDTELCLRVEVESEETCREYGREKAYECLTAGHARNVDALVAELLVLTSVPIMQNNDSDGADD